jgi:short-subunit dehydrogenase
METIIGRESEIKRLKTAVESAKPEFVVLYGRRRIGKTFLINQMFKNQFAFKMTGVIEGKLKDQFTAFADAMYDYGFDMPDQPKDWMQAFIMQAFSVFASIISMRVFLLIVPVIMDLSSVSCTVLSDMLKDKKPDVRILVNNAGMGYMGAFDKMSPEQVIRICNINCTAPAAIMSEVLPYMTKGARILNISSASSFQPNPYLAMYSASKVFLKNLSRAVNNELKARGITVTSVCPGWVDTEMLPRTRNGMSIRYIGMIDPETVVKKALKDSARGKDMSVPGAFAAYLRLYSKIMPTKIVMRQWGRSIKQYL